MTGGVLMSKNNLLLGFILGLMATFFLLRQEGARPYPCLSSTGEDLENDKTFAGNELGE